jgi:hypothetical protein
VALVRIDVSEGRIASIIRLVTANFIPTSPIFVTLMMETIHSSDTRFLQEPRGTTSQKTAFYIVAAVNTSNLRWSEGVSVRVLRRILRLKRDEVTKSWRKPHRKELRELHPSPSIIRIIKSRRLRWAGHVTLMGEKRNAYSLLVESRK